MAQTRKRYSKALKRTVVQAFLRGEAGTTELCKKHHISTGTLIRHWAKQFEFAAASANGHAAPRPVRDEDKDRQSLQNVRTLLSLAQKEINLLGGKRA